MLILSRRSSEGIVLPGLDVLVKVLSVRGGGCRIGISAPPEVTVLREELFDELKHVEKGYLLDSMSRERRHDAMNRLNAIQMGVSVLSSLATSGDSAEIDSVAKQLLEECRHLKSDFDNESVPVVDDDQVAISKLENGVDSSRVLIVEDNENERNLLSRLLAFSGSDVSAVANGSEALNWLDSNEKPDCVVSDMLMPGIDGPTLIRNIRSNPELRLLRVVGMSGFELDQCGLSKKDVDAWVAKPLDVDLLIQAVKGDVATVA